MRSEPRQRPLARAARSSRVLCVAIALCILTACGSQDMGSDQASVTPGSDPDLRGSRPTIHLVMTQEGRTGAVLEVRGLGEDILADLATAEIQSDQWFGILALYVDDGDRGGGEDRPPMLGSHHVEEEVLRFAPRFPLQAGLRYRAAFNPDRIPQRDRENRTESVSPAPIVLEFLLPKPASKPTTIVQNVYPSANRLPENQLKFYLHFSAPMLRGESYRNIHLLRSDGTEVDLPFLELDEELWDPERKRFTLFFDPGRIKRGLKPREELGPSLIEGESYTLLIQRDWKDAKGNILVEDYRKNFRVGPPDDETPNPENWEMQIPVAGTRDPLALIFPEPLDHALLEHQIQVTGDNARVLAGEVTISGEEQRWAFVPEAAWMPGPHRIVVDTWIEDLAGNIIGRPFEVDVFNQVERNAASESVTLRFEVVPQGRRP